MTGRVLVTQKQQDPTPPNTWDDFQWADANRDWLYEEYGVGVALVYHQRVIGSGRSIDDARADAENRYSGESDITPVIVFIPQPGRRVGTWVRASNRETADEQN